MVKLIVDSAELMNGSEAARYLGTSRSYVSWLRVRGRLVAVQIGRAVYYRRCDIEALAQRRREQKGE